MKRIKYFHKLTRGEFSEICKRKMTWNQCAEKYPQPKWCTYPDAVCGVMGCWSLMDFRVKDEQFCKNCDCLKKNEKTK